MSGLTVDQEDHFNLYKSELIQAILRLPIYPKAIFIEENRIQIGLGASKKAQPTSYAEADTFIKGEKKKDPQKEPLRFFGVFPFDFSVNETVWRGFPTSYIFFPTLHLVWENGKIRVIGEKGRSPEKLLEALLQEKKGELNRIKEGKTMQFKDVPREEQWKDIVKKAIKEIHDGKYEKIVLSRAKTAPIPQSIRIDLGQTILSLHHNYRECLTFLIALSEGKAFFGSTPEILGKKTGDYFQTMALAGTVPVSEGEEHARALLLETKKLSEEHKIVVRSITEQLRDFSEKQTVSPSEILRLKNVFHLHTPIHATLKPNIPWYRLIEALHPTPAVGGRPKEVAIRSIRSIEQWERGWYTGLLGWIDDQNNFDLRVALRCGLVNQDKIWVFAGAGIVDASDPSAEWQETESKFQPVLNSLVVTEMER